MVTSTKIPEKKIVRMVEQNSSVVVPQRTLLGEVNEHITCPLCRGYYIDATTIVECLHSFCRSCIIKHLHVKSYCPVCEMMINSARPNIKLDKALQDIVYKLVPGLFQREMERRQQFYASRPGPAASATPEQRGEDTERIIFSPEDVISFSLEYADVTDTDSISSKSSDSNEPQTPATMRRFLQCPAVVNISHLKKFISMKFDIDCSQFAIDILYKRVPLPDYYTLMDIAYIYNWKRNEPMRFFYQIIDYVAIRNRLFDINRKGSNFQDRKPSPTSTEDTNVSSPAPNFHDGSEASSGTDSPMPDDNRTKKIGDQALQYVKADALNEFSVSHNSGKTKPPTLLSKKADDEVEKSQFLNSFELTAKNSSPTKSPDKSKLNEAKEVSKADVVVSQQDIQKDDNLKRKNQSTSNFTEVKKLKIELEKAKLPTHLITTSQSSSTSPITPEKKVQDQDNNKDSDNSFKTVLPQKSIPTLNKQPLSSQINSSVNESPGAKRSVQVSQNISSPKRKASSNDTSTLPVATPPKTVSPLKLQVPKLDSHTLNKPVDSPKPAVKKMPDLKPSNSLAQSPQSKMQPKLRMDLLANNSDPTIDRSKILSQVKTSLGSASPSGQSSGDPLKSLFDSCKLNIPSSLSITLTDQKIDSNNLNDSSTTNDSKKNLVGKNISPINSVIGHKVTIPPVHNYIEILKLPDPNDPKKLQKPDTNTDSKSTNSKPEVTSSQSKINKTSETSATSAKGPVPNLKPIADTKLGKQSANFVAPITFQQTFEQQLQSLQSDKKPKLPKTKGQVPKLVPATKAFTAANKLNNPNKSNTSTATGEKPSTALDLSTPHNIHQTKAFETMQSIANLAKKQNLQTKGPVLNISQSSTFTSVPNRSVTTGVNQPRLPSSNSFNQIKLDKNSLNNSQSQANSSRSEAINKSSNIKLTNNGNTHNVPPSSFQHNATNQTSPALPSPRSTRSPSSSPKLVIAEEKQTTNMTSEQNVNQSNQISSTQLSSINTPKNDSPKSSPGPSSKPGLKSTKPVPPANKITNIRQPITPTVQSAPLNSSVDYLSQPQLMSAHHALLRHQMEMQTAWLKARHDLLKNMSNIAHQTQNDFNNKDK